jgi:hypothetical protein
MPNKPYTKAERKKLYDRMMKSHDNLSVDAKELHVTVQNDSQLHTQQEMPIIKNLLRKMSKGIYDSKKAEKLAKYLFDEGNRRYKKDFGHSFSPAERRQAAEYWVKSFEVDVADGQWSNLQKQIAPGKKTKRMKARM